jgi:hypothetical protein
MMFSKKSDFPPYKKQLKEVFGALSFHCSLINLDVIGIRLVENYEIIVLCYRGKKKVGYFYEGIKLTARAAFNAFNDAPEDYNDLEDYSKEYVGRIEVLAPPKDNYVFINDMEISGVDNVKM